MDIDYKNFRFRAEVDWIELEIRTTDRTNFDAIRRHGNLDHVTALDPGPGGAATRFRFRIQDPSGMHSVTTVLDQLKEHHTFACDPAVTGIEIALDAYGKTPNRAALAALLGHLYRFQSRPASKNQRLCGSIRGYTEAMPAHHDTLVRCLTENWQIVVGSHTTDPRGRWTRDNRAQRFYIKTTDRGRTLPENKRRARYENTYCGDALPSSAMADWHQFRFEGLSDDYSFRAPRTNLDPFGTMLLKRARQLGGRTKRRRGGGARYSPLTTADLRLNELARNALRELSRRWVKSPSAARRPSSHDERRAQSAQIREK